MQLTTLQYGDTAFRGVWLRTCLPLNSKYQIQPSPLANSSKKRSQLSKVGVT